MRAAQSCRRLSWSGKSATRTDLAKNPCYWDTSALLAVFLDEAGSPKAKQLAREGGLPGYTSFFTFIEMESAYARRISEGVLARETLAGLRLKAHEIETALITVWPDQEISADARRIVSETGLRPGDALQLASARASLKSEETMRFASLDQRLNQAARAVGLALAW